MNTRQEVEKARAYAPEQIHEAETRTPPVDVYENKDELLIVADIPGASKESVFVHLEDGQLTLRAKRASDVPGQAGAGEGANGSYDYLRVFSVPRGVDAAKIQAALTAGVLRVHLPKSDAVKPRRIDVRAG